MRKPHLVDISASNYCPFIEKCAVSKYCYANPTKIKPTALDARESDYIKNGLAILAPFNVVFGGYGEFTAVPKYEKFVWILRHTMYATITTRNYKAMHDAHYRFKAFAFSVNSLSDFKEVRKEIDNLQSGTLKARVKRSALQLVIGSIPWQEVKEGIALIPEIETISFLGPKDFGLGHNMNPIDWGNWLNELSDLDRNISFDVVAIEKYKKELTALGIDYTYMNIDPKGSVFIDLARMEMRRHSYDKHTVPVELATKQGEFRDIIYYDFLTAYRKLYDIQ